MNKNIMRQMGFGKAVEEVEQGNCPFCHKKVETDSFKNALSRKEYAISGLCQDCQDETFGG